MNIYLVETPLWSKLSSESILSFVCIANNEQEAREMHPDGKTVLKTNKNRKLVWSCGKKKNTWCEPKDLAWLKVTLIGVADNFYEKYSKKRVIITQKIPKA